MKYLCLIHLDEKKLDTLSKQEYDRLIDESLAYDDVLRASGHFLAAQALEPVSATITLRRANNQPLVTDGPFAETREQIAGFLLIEAKDRNDAVEVAMKIPVFRLGAIEVRPIRERAHTSLA